MVPTKYMLVIIHSLLFVSSLAILITASVFKSSLDGNYALFLNCVDTVVAYVIVFGVSLLITALVTLTSIYYQNTTLESLYYCGMTALIFIEFCMIITGFVDKREALEQVARALRATEPSYKHNRIASVTWNSLQRDLECCGLYRHDEWFHTFGNSSLPDSCCSLYSVGCGKYAVKTNNFHHVGCLYRVSIWARDLEIFVGIIFPLLLILQIFSLPLVRRFQRILH